MGSDAFVPRDLEKCARAAWNVADDQNALFDECTSGLSDAGLEQLYLAPKNKSSKIPVYYVHQWHSTCFGEQEAARLLDLLARTLLLGGLDDCDPEWWQDGRLHPLDSRFFRARRASFSATEARDIFVRNMVLPAERLVLWSESFGRDLPDYLWNLLGKFRKRQGVGAQVSHARQKAQIIALISEAFRSWFLQHGPAELYDFGGGRLEPPQARNATDMACHLLGWADLETDDWARQAIKPFTNKAGRGRRRRVG